jgi:tetratricopeptide (TPR) repeat protein
MRSPITFSLSSLYNVGRLSELQREIAVLEEALRPLQTRYDTVKAEYNATDLKFCTERDEIARDVWEKKEAFEATSKARDAVTAYNSEYKKYYYVVEKNEKSKFFDRAKLDAYEAYDAAEAAYKEAKSRYPDRGPVRLVEDDLRQASNALETQKRKIDRAKKELVEVMANLPDGTAALSVESLDYLSTFSIEGLDIDLEPTNGPGDNDWSLPKLLAMVRGETPFTCDECENGNLIFTSPSHPVRIVSMTDGGTGLVWPGLHGR